MKIEIGTPQLQDDLSTWRKKIRRLMGILAGEGKELVLRSPLSPLETRGMSHLSHCACEKLGHMISDGWLEIVTIVTIVTIMTIEGAEGFDFWTW